MIENLKKLVFPKRDKNKEVDRYSLKSPNIIGITDEQFKKLNRLFLHVYGHGIHPVRAHHHFLQGIVHYNVFDFDDWKDQLSDECIKDVYKIEPKLFDPKVIENYYKEASILVEECDETTNR